MTAVVLPEGIGTKVDSAPGVSTPGDIRLLLPKVWAFVPSIPDPNDNHVQPPSPEDLPIIAAYLEEEAAGNELAVQRPLPTVPSPRLVAAQTPEALANVIAYYKQLAAAGSYFDLGEGIVLRPVVIASPRSDTEAFIFDCVLDGGVLRTADGSPAQGEVAGVKRSPQIARMVRVADRWVTDVVTTDERVCA